MHALFLDPATAALPGLGNSASPTMNPEAAAMFRGCRPCGVRA